VTVVAMQSCPPTPLRDSLPRLETLVSPYAGVVSALHEVLAGPDDARLIRIGATVAALEPRRGRGDPFEGGTGGWAERRDEARAAAIGEAAERYAGSLLPEDALELATAAELGDIAVDPRRFALFAPEQYAQPAFLFVPFTPDTRVRWVRGFSLPHGSESMLPAQLVFLTWGRLVTGEACIGYSTSSGLACGPTLEEAVLAGLLELVERDAFMVVWTNRLSLPLLDWSDDPELTAFEMRYLAPAGARHAAVDLSVFFDVPTALGVVEGDGSAEPALSVGAGCAATIGGAVRKALAEAYAVRSWGRSLARRGDTGAPEVTTFADHIRLYTRADAARAARFLTASPVRRPVAEVAPLSGATPLEQIRELVDHLAARGASAYAVDVTTDDIAAARLAVAKVVAPELCPLDVRHDARFLGGERLYRAAFELGLRDAPLAFDDVNPAPHPFP
jgi:ribosomal protein S12 methylthiotransferase accessory factor